MSDDQIIGSTSAPPVLETERLLLSGHSVRDFEPLTAMWQAPAIVDSILGGKPATPRESWLRLLRYRGLWPLLGFGYWAVREKASGRYAGDLGFADFHRATEPSIKGLPEAGWAFAPWAHGQGYATEALTAALTWLDGQQRFSRCVCLIDPANAPSIRVAEKAGFRDRRSALMDGRETLLFSRPIFSAAET